MRAKRIAALAVATAALAISLAYIALTFEWNALLGALLISQPGWFLAGGSAAVVGYWLTRALRWSWLMRGMRPRPGFADLYLCSSAALGLSVLTPLQAGEALKVELLRTYGGGARLPGYSAFLVERVADLYVVAAMAVLALAGPHAVLLAIALVILPLAGLLVLQRLRPGGALGEFVAHVRAAAGSAPHLLLLLALTALGWLIVALGWQACLLSLSIRLDFRELLGLLSIVTLASTLSFIPAGLGIADASAAALMIRYGVDAPLAQAGALLLRAFTPLVVVLGVLHLAWLRGRRRGTL